MGKKGGKCHEEESAHLEQGQPQGRCAHQGITRHDVLQGRIVSVADTLVARGKLKMPLATIFYYLNPIKRSKR